MNAVQIIQAAERVAGELRIVNGRIATAGKIPPELADAIAANAPAIFEYLAGRERRRAAREALIRKTNAPPPKFVDTERRR